MTERLGSRVVAAFAVVYIVWGSTYLAIRYAVETLPPFLAACRRKNFDALVECWGGRVVMSKEELTPK